MDLSLIAQAASSLSSAVTLTKSFVGLRDEAQRLTAVNEMLTKLLEANNKLNAFAIADAQRTTEHQAVLSEKRNLEEELRRVKAEKADFERYALHELSPGVLVYARGAGVEGTEPAHYLCARCRSEGKKSILQRGETAAQVFHRCPQCSTAYVECDKLATWQPLPTKSPGRRDW